MLPLDDAVFVAIKNALTKDYTVEPKSILLSCLIAVQNYVWNEAEYRFEERSAYDGTEKYLHATVFDAMEDPPYFLRLRKVNVRLKELSNKKLNKRMMSKVLKGFTEYHKQKQWQYDRYLGDCGIDS